MLMIDPGIPLGIQGSRFEGPHTRWTSLGGVPRINEMLNETNQSSVSPSILVYKDNKNTAKQLLGRPLGLGARGQGAGCRVQVVGCKIQGAGYRV